MVGISVAVILLPYTLTRAIGVTEEVIEEYLGRVGQVINFRLVVDKETGKPKGYGFAEYADVDAAASAVRNLNATELHGRQLRVDYANEGNKDKEDDSARHTAGVNGHEAAQAPSAELPPLPTGRDLDSHLTAEDAISKTLETLPPPQLLDVLGQFQAVATAEPAKATALLQNAPQAAYAIFQALLLLKLVDANALTTIIKQNTAVPAPAPPQAAPPQPTQQHPYGGYPPAPQPYAGHVPTPPVQQPYQPPPAVAAPPPGVPPDKVDLIRQLMSMPQAAIDALPPDQRNQILTLRQQYAAAFPNR